MTVREACKRLRKLGWQFVRQKGGHRQFRKGGQVITVAGAHPGKRATTDVVKLIQKLEGQS